MNIVGFDFGMRIPRHRDHLFHQYDRSFQIDRDR